MNYGIRFGIEKIYNAKAFYLYAIYNCHFKTIYWAKIEGIGQKNPRKIQSTDAWK
jgi:hypothetical protein